MRRVRRLAAHLGAVHWGGGAGATEVDIIVVATQTCTLLTLMCATAATQTFVRCCWEGRLRCSACRYARCLKIGFFEAEGISDQAMATGLMIIQLFPLFIAFIIIAWLVWSLYGDIIEEKQQALQAVARLQVGKRVGYRASCPSLPRPHLPRIEKSRGWPHPSTESACRLATTPQMVLIQRQARHLLRKLTSRGLAVSATSTTIDVEGNTGTGKVGTTTR